MLLQQPEHRFEMQCLQNLQQLASVSCRLRHRFGDQRGFFRHAAVLKRGEQFPGFVAAAAVEPSAENCNDLDHILGKLFLEAGQ